MKPENVMSVKQLTRIIAKTAKKHGVGPRAFVQSLIDMACFQMLTSFQESTGISDDTINGHLDYNTAYFKHIGLDMLDVCSLLVNLIETVRNVPGDPIWEIAKRLGALDQEQISGNPTTYVKARALTSLMYTNNSIDEMLLESGRMYCIDEAAHSGAVLISIFEQYRSKGYHAQAFIADAYVQDVFSFKMCVLQLYLKSVPARVILGSRGDEGENPISVSNGFYVCNRDRNGDYKQAA